MNSFLDILPIIFYCIAGIIVITYNTIFTCYNWKITKKSNVFFLILVMFFGILSIVSSMLFWLCY